jgi:hypothetical protein
MERHSLRDEPYQPGTYNFTAHQFTRADERIRLYDDKGQLLATLTPAEPRSGRLTFQTPTVLSATYENRGKDFQWCYSIALSRYRSV